MTSSNQLGFSPNFPASDALARYWIERATLMLRREVAWLWHTRTAQGGQIPPAVIQALNDHRLSAEKSYFWSTDPGMLSLQHQLDNLNRPPLPALQNCPRGSFSWIVRTLTLNDFAQFTLGLCLLAIADPSSLSIIAAVQNDATATQVTPALLRTLTAETLDALAILDDDFILFQYGLIERAPSPLHRWHQGLVFNSTCTQRILGLAPVPPSKDTSLTGLTHLELKIGQSPYPTLTWLAETRGRKIVEVSETEFARALSSAWLEGHDLYLHEPSWPTAHSAWTRALLAPVEVIVGSSQEIVRDARRVHRRLSAVQPQWQERLAAWRQNIQGPEAPLVAQDLALRYSLTAEEVETICRETPAPHTRAALLRTTRARHAHSLHGLATRIEPRFSLNDLVLPAKTTKQFQDILTSMSSLGKIQSSPELRRVWGESGLSVLFAGAPGTGKTMAAEVLAHELDLPLYRVDLSQTVNKYIGETEKNLARIFDAADSADALLLFDEADALFGRRTQVRDSHDRFANLEISYLLERMERFRGLSVLATNRRNDIDDAFLRRLRYLVEFPIPGYEERLRIWRAALPLDQLNSEIDLRFLAESFPLTGGHIRSAVLNAALQGAGQIDMEKLLWAIKWECEKIGRPLNPAQFGRYRMLIEEAESGHA